MSRGEAGKSEGMTLLGHLGELRRRLLHSVIAVAVCIAVSFAFHKQLFDILIRPTGGIDLIFIEMTEMIGTTMKVSLLGGLVLAMPYLIYQLLMFVSPGLTRREKKYVYLILPWITLMFAAGVVFAYYVLIPPAAKFLVSFGSDIATPQIKVGNYISIVTRLLLAVGAVFEAPVIIVFLSRLGIVTPRMLSRNRRWAILGAFVLAAIITPTFDPINQSLVAVPLILLYEMSLWLSKLVYRRRARLAPSPRASP